jgi:hypothetical protein
MFAMILIIRGEQKVSMNRQKRQGFQLLLLLAYILESAMVIGVFYFLSVSNLIFINFFVCAYSLLMNCMTAHFLDDKLDKSCEIKLV